MKVLTCAVVILLMTVTASAGFLLVPTWDTGIETTLGVIVHVGIWQYMAWHVPPVGMRHVVMSRPLPDGPVVTLFDYEAATDGVRCWYPGLQGLWGMEREFMFSVGCYEIIYQIRGAGGEIYAETVFEVEVEHAWAIRQ